MSKCASDSTRHNSAKASTYPFRPDYSDLIAAVDWARGHTAQASAIAAAAARLVNMRLRRDDALCYTYRPVRNRLACRARSRALQTLPADFCTLISSLGYCRMSLLVLRRAHHHHASCTCAACSARWLVYLCSFPRLACPLAGCFWSMRLCTAPSPEQQGQQQGQLEMPRQHKEQRDGRMPGIGAAAGPAVARILPAAAAEGWQWGSCSSTPHPRHQQGMPLNGDCTSLPTAATPC